MKRIKGPQELCLVVSTRWIFALVAKDPRQCQLIVVDRLLIVMVGVGEVPRVCQLALTRITFI